MTDEQLIDRLLDGDHRALARVITKIEDRTPGYRDLVSELYHHTSDVPVIGITGSPGSGKSTLVDKLAATYRERGYTVGVIAVDPSSPFTGGAVLGDRIRMASNVGDMEVFFRSMSARGTLGGLSTATSDAVKALDAFGKDVIFVETVGAGQNEIDVVRTTDTVAVLVPPSTGDAVQMLKAGILEIADVFVVNKADMEGADRTVQELREMIQLTSDTPAPRMTGGGHHGADTAGSRTAGGHGRTGGTRAREEGDADEAADGPWVPEIVETVATDGQGVDELIAAFENHRTFMEQSGRLEEKVRTRYAEEIRNLLREDVGEILEDEIRRRGGMDELVDAVLASETDPYTISDEITGPIADCLDEP
jgi:LAO/AO transport system kinase